MNIEFIAENWEWLTAAIAAVLVAIWNLLYKIAMAKGWQRVVAKLDWIAKLWRWATDLYRKARGRS